MLSRRHDNTPIVSDKGDDGISPEERKNGQTAHSSLRMYRYVYAFARPRARVCARVSVSIHRGSLHIMRGFRKFRCSRDHDRYCVAPFVGDRKTSELFMTESE